MKEFFVWYMVASIIGAWALLAYAFYRISQLSHNIELHLIFVKKRLDTCESVIARLEGTCIRLEREQSSEKLKCQNIEIEIEIDKTKNIEAAEIDFEIVKEHIGEWMIIHAERGSYFCILKSIEKGPNDMLYAVSESAYRFNLSVKKLSEFQNGKFSIIDVSRKPDGFIIGRIKSIDTCPTMIAQMHQVIRDVNS